MNNEILKLAEECGARENEMSGDGCYNLCFKEEELQAFYEAAKQQGRDEEAIRWESLVSESNLYTKGLEDGKVIGRDEVMLAMSKIAPVGYCRKDVTDEFAISGHASMSKSISFLHCVPVYTIPKNAIDWHVEFLKLEVKCAELKQKLTSTIDDYLIVNRQCEELKQKLADEEECYVDTNKALNHVTNEYISAKATIEALQQKLVTLEENAQLEIDRLNDRVEQQDATIESLNLRVARLVEVINVHDAWHKEYDDHDGYSKSEMQVATKSALYSESDNQWLREQKAEAFEDFIRHIQATFTPSLRVDYEALINMLANRAAELREVGK